MPSSRSMSLRCSLPWPNKAIDARLSSRTSRSVAEPRSWAGPRSGLVPLLEMVPPLVGRHAGCATQGKVTRYTTMQTIDQPGSPPPRTQRGSRLPELVEVMERLLADDGCPWDREQTLRTLRPFLIEEAHEVLEAIDADDPHGHCDELGDVLFQIVF